MTAFVAWQQFPATHHHAGKFRAVGQSKDYEGMKFLAGPRGKVTEYATSEEAVAVYMKRGEIE